jgi:hypothetical protein
VTACTGRRRGVRVIGRVAPLTLNDFRHYARGGPIKVTSLNPLRDAGTIGHVVAQSRAVSEGRGTALQHRFTRLLAEGESPAIAAADRAARIAKLLDQLAWAQQSITDEIVTLESAKAAPEQRDALLRAIVEEIAVMAELSTGRPFATAPWRDVLDALHLHVEELLARDAHDAILLADIDLALERIEHIENTAADAVHSYLGFLSA